MRWGTNAEQQRRNAEELRQRRQMADDDGLSEIPADTVEDLFTNDGGDSELFFILGLHDPSSPTPRQFGTP